MKKLLTVLLVVFFSSTLFAQNLAEKQFDAKQKPSIKKVRGMNHLLYNKKKELGKLKKNQTQIPHPPEEDNVVIWSESYESFGPISTITNMIDWYEFGSTEDQAATTKFNAYNADEGGSSWWIGINDADVLARPGYGWLWNVSVYSADYHFLQSDLEQRSFRFRTFYNIEEGFDAAYLQIRTDAVDAEWETLACYNGDTDGQWVSEEVDIPEDYNGEYVEFRFLFYSDFTSDSDDGSFGAIGNPGGFFFDNFQLVRDDVPELLDDGGDNALAFNVDDDIPFPAPGFVITGDEASDGDSSLAIQSYERPTDAMVLSGPIDLTTTGLGANYAAPLWWDFDVLAQGLPEPPTEIGAPYVGWIPVVYVLTEPDPLKQIQYPTVFAYAGDFEDDGDFVTWSDHSGYINMTDYYGEVIMIGFEFWAPQECGVEYGGEIYWDNLKLIQVNDPYEYNNECDTASQIEYGHITEYANTFDSSGTDVDYYYFEGEEGDWVDVYVDNSNTNMYLALLSAENNETCGSIMEVMAGCCSLESYDDGELYDRVIWRLPYTGGYFILTYSAPQDTASYVLWLDKLQETATVTSVTDVPEDQGKKVRIQFEAPELDNFDEVDFSKWGAQTVGFQIERKQGIVSPGWDVVDQLDAFGLGNPDSPYPYYVREVPTKADSINQTFRVRTKTGNVDRQGLFTMVGVEGTGQSYDNIAPTFVEQYTLSPESGEGIDVAAVADYGGGNDGISDIAFYNIYRSDASGFTPSAANKIATIETHNAEIRYNDAEYDGTVAYYYVIEVVDDGGNKAFSDEVNTITSVENEAVPTVYSLAQNYPNPFNPATTIKFGIPQAADVTIKIYDILGQEVQTLVNRNLSAGFHTVNFNASNLISGMYIYRIQANGVDGSNFTDVKKMLLVK